MYNNKRSSGEEEQTRTNKVDRIETGNGTFITDPHKIARTINNYHFLKTDRPRTIKTT